MKNWMNKSVKLNDTWGAGAIDSLSTPLGSLPEFSMRARHLRDAKGQRHCAHFSIDFASGYLADGWQGVNFIPMGDKPVSGIFGLPPWDPSQRDTYKNMINAAATSLGDSRTERLEAVIPYIGQQGGVGYNRVRLFYVIKAVKGPDADLVVIKIATHVPIPGTVQARQEGIGHGPPK